MDNVGKSVDAVLKRKKAIGLFLLALGALIYVTDRTELFFSSLGSSLGSIALLLIIAGVIFLAARRRET